MGALLSSTILCGRSLLATKVRRNRRGVEDDYFKPQRTGEAGVNPLFMWWCKFLNYCTCRQFVYFTMPWNWLAYPCNYIPVPIMICAMPYKYCAIIHDTRYEIAKLHAYSRTPECRVVSVSSPFRIISSISPRRDSSIFLRSSKE